MNTSRNVARILEEEVANLGVPPSSDQVPPLEEHVNDYQAPVNPPSLIDDGIRSSILHMDQTFILKYKPPQLKLRE